MLKRTLTSCLLCCGLLGGMATSQEELSPLERYQESQRYSLAQDKRTTSRQTILSSNDEATLMQAYEDLLCFSASDEQKADALEKVSMC